MNSIIQPHYLALYFQRDLQEHISEIKKTKIIFLENRKRFNKACTKEEVYVAQQYFESVKNKIATLS